MEIILKVQNSIKRTTNIHNLYKKIKLFKNNKTDKFLGGLNVSFYSNVLF